MKNLLVTGGAGFIGSYFIKYMLKQYPDSQIINYDCLTYAGNLENLTDVSDSPNYYFIKGNITDRNKVDEVVGNGVDAIINFAAESHVDRSIEGPEIFVLTNVLGTQILLDVAKRYNVSRFIQVSTDEVYGSLGPTGTFNEQTPLAPNSPYSASKAGADMLVRSYHETFGISVNITRCSNNYGPFQFPEKLIPLIISNALENKNLPVYGDGLNVRDWLHVKDHCRAIDAVLHKGTSGQVYNIGGNNEKTNIEIIRFILRELEKPESLIEFVKDRPGHDRRYAIDSNKIQQEIGWVPEYSFEEGLRETIKWYLNNQDWINKVKSGEYKDYYKRMYEGRQVR